jgi:anti-anti-sigma factor
MNIAVSEVSDVVILKPEGSMDASNTNIFVHACQERLETGTKKMVVDLAGIEYISSAGLRGVLTVLKACRAQHAEVAFSSLQPMVAEVFKISGFTAMMPIFDTPEAAMSTL